MLQEEYPGEFNEVQMRTFRRRIAKYKLLEGKGKEIMFPQPNLSQANLEYLISP